MLASTSQSHASDAIRIDQISVGTNVLATNPLGERDDQFGEEVDPFTWKRITLKANKADGSWAEVELLRPDWWLALHEAREGGTVHIDVPECGIDGEAVVEAISACPPFAPPLPGYRTVTGTFKHHSAQVVDLAVEGLAEPIGTTANHPFYSLDRAAFIRADELQPRERLHSLHGETRVVSITPRAISETVYNLEVQVDHVYHVSTSGVLVHNGGLRCFPNWKVGNSITQALPDGTYPQWYSRLASEKHLTIQGRYWANRATWAAPGEFTDKQLRNMRAGFAPQIKVIVRDIKSGQLKVITESKELHHNLASRGVPGFDEPMHLREVWPWQHGMIDSQRRTGYEFIMEFKENWP